MIRTRHLLLLFAALILIGGHLGFGQSAEEQAGLIPTAHGYVAGGLDCGRH